MKLLSPMRLFAIPWTIAYQTPLLMANARQEYWSGLPFPSPGDLFDPEIEPSSPAFRANALPSEPPGKPNRTRGLTTLTHCNLANSFFELISSFIKWG